MSALAVVVLLYARPELAHEVSQYLAPAAAEQAAPAEAPALAALAAVPVVQAPAKAQSAPLTDDEKAMLANRKQQQHVTAWLSKRYRVAGDAANMFVATAYLTARDIKLDPLLILAVMAIESRLNPFAESPVGAQGLMQVMSKVHHARFRELGGTKAALNPVANIRVGSEILKEYVSRGGSVEAGLKTYVGAGAFDTDSGYGSRVMAEYNKLKLVAKGKHVPTFTPPAAAPAPAAVSEKVLPLKTPEPAIKEDTLATL